MTQAAEKRRHNCASCGDTGLIYPPRAQRGSLAAAVRAMPLPCSFCEAGELELQLQTQMFGQPCGPEIEIMQFRAGGGK